jgi:hypothetical protein
MKTKIVILSLLLALFVIAAGVALANDVFELPRWTLGGGVSDSAAGDVTLRATLGQPLVGAVSGGDVTLGQGFWHGGGLLVGDYDSYLPFVQS